MDLRKITAGYFNMSDDKKQEIQISIIAECLIAVYIHEISKEVLFKHLDEIEQKGLEREDYEIAEVMSKTKDKLKEIL